MIPNNVHYLRGKKLAQSESDLRSTLVYWLEEAQAGRLRGIAAGLLWDLDGKHEVSIEIHGTAKTNPGVALTAAECLRRRIKKILWLIWDKPQKRAKPKRADERQPPLPFPD
jgi:hypothetical protein